jgi:hypothetical protein
VSNVEYVYGASNSSAWRDAVKLTPADLSRRRWTRRAEDAEPCARPAVRGPRAEAGKWPSARWASSGPTLQNRLGFGAAGAAAGVNAPIIDSFLFNAQVQLYEQFDWPRLKYRADKTMGIGQTLYDYPTIAAGAPADANEDRILDVEVNLTSTGQPALAR